MPWRFLFLDEDVQAAIASLDPYQLADLKLAKDLLNEFGPQSLPLSLSKAMGNGLFEFKLRGSDTSARVFYAFLVEQRLIFLHAFVKKTQKTPAQELKMARKKLHQAQAQERARVLSEATQPPKQGDRDARRR